MEDKAQIQIQILIVKQIQKEIQIHIQIHKNAATCLSREVAQLSGPPRHCHCSTEMKGDPVKTKN